MSSHARMWKLDHKEGCMPEIWCFQTVVLGKTLVCPLDSEEIKPVNLKGNYPFIFIRMTDAEAPILWPPNAKSQVTGEDPAARKDWRQEEKQMTEDEMVGWCHQFKGQKFEQTPGDSEGQGNPVCCSPWDQSQTQLSD